MKTWSDKKRIITGAIFASICMVLCVIGAWACVHIRRSGQDQTKAAGMENAGQSGVQDAGSEGLRGITPDSVIRTMDGILLWQCAEYGVSDVQELLDKAYAGRAANGTVQTYVMGLYGYKQEYDYMCYYSGLQNVLAEEEVSTMSLQKSTMVLSALQADNPIPADLLEETIEKQGIMSYLYGLLMLDGIAAADGRWTRDALVREILSRQLPDGGFAIAGTDGDTDVTAMALQALAPYYLKAQENVQAVTEDGTKAQEDVQAVTEDGNEAQEDMQAVTEDGNEAQEDMQAVTDDGNEAQEDMQAVTDDGSEMQEDARASAAAENESDVRIVQAVEDALAFLSANQLVTGDFANNGTPNAESTAQVILALCALERDVWADEAFIKEGATLLDGLSRYQNMDGGFSHTEGTASNDMASSQVFAALSAVNRSMSGECFLFDFAAYERDGAEERDLAEPQDNLTPGQEGMSQNRPEQEHIPTVGFDIRAALIFLVLAAGCGYLACLCFFKKYSRKRLGGVLLVTVVLAVAIWFIRIQTREEYLLQDNGQGGAKSITVSMEIRCDTVAGAEEFLPQDGVILAKTKVSAGEGESAFDVLRETARMYDIPVEYEGTAAGDEFAYIEGIAYLYEYDFGELSGWIFIVNGETPNVGCGAYRVADGDEIIWYYTRELGRDVMLDS